MVVDDCGWGPETSLCGAVNCAGQDPEWVRHTVCGEMCGERALDGSEVACGHWASTLWGDAFMCAEHGDRHDVMFAAALAAHAADELFEPIVATRTGLGFPLVDDGDVF